MILGKHNGGIKSLSEMKLKSNYSALLEAMNSFAVDFRTSR